MDLLERIFGVETMARVREEARQAQARALAQTSASVSVPARQTPGVRQALAKVAPQARPAGAPVPQPVRIAAPESAGGFIDALPADFPTSILGTAAAATPPLLGAFASREALLAAIVYSEALAPPIALR